MYIEVEGKIVDNAMNEITKNDAIKLTFIPKAIIKRYIKIQSPAQEYILYNMA